MSIKAKAGDYVVRTLFDQVEWQEWRDKTNNKPVRVDEVKTKADGTVVYSTPEVQWKFLNDPWWDARGFGGKIVPPPQGEGTGEGVPDEHDDKLPGSPTKGDGDKDKSDDDTKDKDKDKDKQSQSSQPPPSDIPVGDLLTLEQVKGIRELVEKARKDNPQWTDGFQAMCDLVVKGCESVWQKQQSQGVHTGEPQS